MKLVINDKASGNAYNKKTEEALFLNRKIGEEVDLEKAGMPGYKARITGGSDTQGFPMKPSLEGQARKKLLVKKGIGIKSDRKGLIMRKTMRGNTVGPDIVQLNLVITKTGDKPIEEFISPGEKKEESKESAKERMIKQSLENVGNLDMAEEAKKIKGKVRG
jgi:small subunit ribosomal protein S6e